MNETGVAPCFVNCGEPACRTLGCIRVYNARHRDTDMDSSPFDEPSYETVEKGLNGPWEPKDD